MRATASKVGLLSNCRWWARPEAEWAHTTSAAAERGTAFHEAAAHYIETGEPLIVREDVAPLLAVAIQWVDSFGREVLAAEVALAWCPKADAAEVIGRNIGRDYSKGAGRLCGSADLVAVQRNLPRVRSFARWR